MNTLFILNNFPKSLPLTEIQAVLLSITIIVFIIILNVLNAIINAKINKKQNEVLLKQISKELLIYSGYLREHTHTYHEKPLKSE